MKPTRRPSPLLTATFFRGRYDSLIPKTWEEYFEMPRSLNAYQVCRLIEEQCGCDFDTASEAVAAAMPELYCDYWMRLAGEDAAELKEAA